MRNASAASLISSGSRARTKSTPRGWTRLYGEHVLQADTGADLDFLVGASGHPVPKDSH